MYHWNIADLVEDFRNNEVSEKDKFNYYVATSLMVALVSSAFLGSSETSTTLDYFSDFCELLITYFGIQYVYQINAGQGSFIERVICISWPLMLKFIVYSIIAYIPVAILGAGTQLHPTPAGKSFLDFLMNAVFILTEILFYWRLGYWIKVLNEKSSEPSENTLKLADL